MNFLIFLFNVGIYVECLSLFNKLSYIKSEDISSIFLFYLVLFGFPSSHNHLVKSEKKRLFI